MEKEKLLTLDEAAERLRVDPETVRNYINSGKLKGVKLAGWTTRVGEQDLEKFIEESKTDVRTAS